MDCSLPSSSVHGFLQIRILECVAIPFSGGIFPTQGSNLSPTLQTDSVPLRHQGSPSWTLCIIKFSLLKLLSFLCNTLLTIPVHFNYFIMPHCLWPCSSVYNFHSLLDLAGGIPLDFPSFFPSLWGHLKLLLLLNLFSFCSHLYPIAIYLSYWATRYLKEETEVPNTLYPTPHRD